MSRLEKFEGKDFRGCTLVAVRKSALSDRWRIHSNSFNGSSCFSILYYADDHQVDYIEFDPKSWTLEIIENLFFLKRVHTDPTHCGHWPHPDSDLYIIVTK